MVWNKQHDGADLDEKLHRLRQDPFDTAPRMIEIPEDYLVALEAKAVRFSAMMYASRELTDGVLDLAVLPMIAGNSGVYQHRIMRAIDALVAAKLLKKRTKRLGQGWDIPNFLKYNPSKDQVQRRKAASSRLSWLQNTAAGRRVRDLIRERDDNRCRYCYIELRQNDQRSTFRLTYDHVRPNDPELDRDHRWIVQSCQFHNGQKLDRTPEEAGLFLLPPWSEADELMRVRAKDQQEIALVVAATLSEQDPDPETIIAAVREVLRTRSKHKSPNTNRDANEMRPGPDPVSPSGRAGTGEGSATAARAVVESVPPPDDSNFPHDEEQAS